MSVEVRHHSITEGVKVSLSQAKEERRGFGRGRLGRAAFRMVAKGRECGLNNCLEKGTQTLDFDVLGSAEQLPVCSPEHRALLEERIEQDLNRIGRSTVFGRNGFGRA